MEEPDSIASLRERLDVLISSAPAAVLGPGPAAVSSTLAVQPGVIQAADPLPHEVRKAPNLAIFSLHFIHHVTKGIF